MRFFFLRSPAAAGFSPPFSVFLKMGEMQEGVLFVYD